MAAPGQRKGPDALCGRSCGQSRATIVVRHLCIMHQSWRAVLGQKQPFDASDPNVGNPPITDTQAETLAPERRAVPSRKVSHQAGQGHGAWEGARRTMPSGPACPRASPVRQTRTRCRLGARESLRGHSWFSAVVVKSLAARIPHRRQARPGGSAATRPRRD